VVAVSQGLGHVFDNIFFHTVRLLIIVVVDHFDVRIIVIVRRHFPACVGRNGWFIVRVAGTTMMTTVTTVVATITPMRRFMLLSVDRSIIFVFSDGLLFVVCVLTGATAMVTASTKRFVLLLIGRSTVTLVGDRLIVVLVTMMTMMMMAAFGRMVVVAGRCAVVFVFGDGLFIMMGAMFGAMMMVTTAARARRLVLLIIG
jgi:hypothetical protein